MKERPIPFSAPMVRAILNGTKTQTRRVIKPKQLPEGHWMVETLGTRHELTHWDSDTAETSPIVCPCGQPGDRLWVREAWKAHTTFDHLPPREIPQTHVWYMADDGYKAESRFRQGMFMPRWASRILLEVVSVRVERLNDISEADAVAEGVQNSLHLPGGRFANENFAHLWWTINGDGSWEANPWVWVIEFKRTAKASETC